MIRKNGIISIEDGDFHQVWASMQGLRTPVIWTAAAAIMQHYCETWHDIPLLHVAPLLHDVMKLWTRHSCSVGIVHYRRSSSTAFANFSCVRSLLCLFSSTDFDVSAPDL